MSVRRRRRASGGTSQASNRGRRATLPTRPDAVARLYNFPAAGRGAGQTVAIIELGGGYRTSDLTAYFSRLNVSPAPEVTAVSVDGARNQPVGDPGSADGEVLLDIEIVGAIAPGARIAVYFAPNTDQGFLDAITTAVHDGLRQPSIVSISWGGPESTWTPQSLMAYDQAFQDAGLLGVTVCCASGDDGSTDNVNDGAAHVDFPASSPHVLACGGTRLESSGGKISSEVVWNHGAGNGATGGGVSDHFPLPAYQAGAKVPVSVNPSRFKGRGVPDIAGDADPATGYQILVDGKDCGLWRNQRGRAAMGGPDSADQRTDRDARRVREWRAVRGRSERRTAGYYGGKQRGLSSRRRMGRLHRLGESQRRGPAQSAREQIAPEEILRARYRAAIADGPGFAARGGDCRFLPRSRTFTVMRSHRYFHTPKEHISSSPSREKRCAASALEFACSGQNCPRVRELQAGFGAGSAKHATPSKAMKATHFMTVLSRACTRAPAL